jgi:hypothetical protein
MTDKLRFVSYTAGAIESATMKEMTDWRHQLEKDLPKVTFYNPVDRESQKVGKPSGEHVKYITGLKKSGNWDKFYSEMLKIWFGNIKCNGSDMADIFKTLRMRKQIDGNELRDLDYFADFEAVIRSDFTVAFMPKDVKTIGTIIEIFVAAMFEIPVYLILDAPKTETNSTLLMLIILSKGEVFYSLKDCVTFIKERYKL